MRIGGGRTVRTSSPQGCTQDCSWWTQALAYMFTGSSVHCRVAFLHTFKYVCSGRLVLIDPHGNTITRDGAALVEIGRRCDAAREAKEKGEEELVKEREAVEKEQAKYRAELAKLSPIEMRIKMSAAGLRRLSEAERAEMAEFIKEPQPSEEAKALLRCDRMRIPVRIVSRLMAGMIRKGCLNVIRLNL